MSNKPKKLEQTLTNWALDLMNSHDLDFKGLLDKLPSLRPDNVDSTEPLPRDPSDEELDAVVDENGKIHWK
jgi:hypothetical protein